MKFVKIGGIICGVLIILLLITPFVIPKKLYLNWAIQTIESNHPVSVTIQDAGLTLLPQPRLLLYNIEIKARSKQSHAKFLKAESLNARATWAAIFSRRWNLAVSLDTAEIHLTQLGPDYYNYTPLLSTRIEAPEPFSLIPSVLAEEVGLSQPLALRRLEARQTVVYHKSLRQDPKEYRFEKLIVRNIRRQGQVYSFESSVIGKLDDVSLAGDIKTKVGAGKIQISSKSLSLAVPKKVALDKQVVSLEGQWLREPDSFRLKEGILQLGSQTLAVSGLQREKSLEFELAAERVQLESLQKFFPELAALPPIEDASIKVFFKKGPKTSGKPRISGSIKAKKVTLPEQVFEDVSGSFLFVAPSLKVQDFKGRLWGGHFEGIADLKLGESSPRYDFDINLKDVKVEQIDAIKGLVLGTGDLALKAAGQGFEKAWAQTLNGKGQVNLKQVQLQGLALLKPLFNVPAWQLIERVPGAINREVLENCERC